MLQEVTREEVGPVGGHWEGDWSMGASASHSGRIKYELVDVLDSVSGVDEEGVFVVEEETGRSARW